MIKLMLATTLLAANVDMGQSYGGRCHETTTGQQDTLDANTEKKKKGLINRIIDYISNSNKERSDGKFDFSILGGPHYDTDTELGLGIVATGIYRTERTDTLLPLSNTALYGDVCTSGYYMLGIRGTHIFPEDRYRIEYNVSFDSFDSKFWGIGYEMGNDDNNESEMHRLQVQAKVSFLFRLADNLYAGPVALYDYAYAKDVERPELLNGMDRRTWNVGAGISLVYDTRDVLTNPHKGFYINLSQYFRPAFMGNDYAFSTTDLRASAYTRVWKGGTVAADLRSMFNFGDPSWGMMSQLGGSYSMRGYYEGRYRDKHKIEAQVELRQHIWGRNGIVAWAGAGTVFNKFSGIHADRILPNFGIGYRWEFKKDVNVRLDYGFGKGGQSGFMFNISEAF